MIGMLSGNEIIKQINEGNIVINPFNQNQINPNSYNITLADELYIYEDDLLDCKKDNKTKKIKLTNEGYVLSPGQLYLGMTNEYTESNQYVPQLSGRSSIGRVGLTVHISAGIGAVGYQGTWTLGISCLLPTKIYPGMAIGQIYFFPLIGANSIQYAGKYTGKKVNASKIHIEYAKQ